MAPEMDSVLVTAGVTAGVMAGVAAPGVTIVTEMDQDGTRAQAGVAATLPGVAVPTGEAKHPGNLAPGMMVHGTTVLTGEMRLAGVTMDQAGEITALAGETADQAGEITALVWEPMDLVWEPTARAWARMNPA